MVVKNTSRKELAQEGSRNEDLRFFKCLVVLCPPCSSQDGKDCKSGLRDSSGYDSLGFAKNRGVRSWPGLESRAPNIGVMGCAMQAIPPAKSGRGSNRICRRRPDVGGSARPNAVVRSTPTTTLTYQ